MTNASETLTPAEKALIEEMRNEGERRQRYALLLPKIEQQDNEKRTANEERSRAETNDRTIGLLQAHTGALAAFARKNDEAARSMVDILSERKKASAALLAQAVALRAQGVLGVVDPEPIGAALVRLAAGRPTRLIVVPE
jgi:hypothetical protein